MYGGTGADLAGCLAGTEETEGGVVAGPATWYPICRSSAVTALIRSGVGGWLANIDPTLRGDCASS